MSLEWSQVVVFATVVIGLIGGVKTVPFVNWLKSFFNLSGRKAQALTVVVATLVSVLTLVVGGALSPQPVDPQHVVTLLTLVLGASQAEYNRIKNSNLVVGAAIEPLPEQGDN